MLGTCQLDARHWHPACLWSPDTLETHIYVRANMMSDTMCLLSAGIISLHLLLTLEVPSGFWHNDWLDPCTVGLSTSCPGHRNVMRDSGPHSALIQQYLLKGGEKCVDHCDLWASSPGSCIIRSQLHGSVFAKLFIWAERSLSAFMTLSEPQPGPPKGTALFNMDTRTMCLLASDFMSWRSQSCRGQISCCTVT